MSAALSKVKQAFSLPSNPFAVAKAPPTVIDAVPVEEMIAVPTGRRAVMSGAAELPNLSTALDADRLQSAIRTAERGDTWQLFAIYRDMVMGYAHLQAELMKRKCVVIGQPHALIPKDKNNADDVRCAKAIEEMIAGCENWMDGLSHLLDASLYPVAVNEKIFAPLDSDDLDDFTIPVRFKLKNFASVNPQLLCFKLAYSPNMMINHAPFQRMSGGYWAASDGANSIAQYDPNAWESELRFYDTMPTGYVDFSMASVYPPDRNRHIVHRGDALSRTIRDNFGGPMRAILFWWLLATKDRDWFGQFMQKYGSPFLVGKANAQDKGTVDLLTRAFSLATQIGGIVIDKRAELELQQASATDGANSHKTLINVCNDEVSKIVVGQILSSTPKSTGLGSGVAELHGEVRQDYRLFDMRKLSHTLKRQLFKPYLRMNGIRGSAPDILWGGEKEGDAKMLAESISQFAMGGLTPTDDGIDTISQRSGIGMRRKTKEDYAVEAGPQPSAPAFGGK